MYMTPRQRALMVLALGGFIGLATSLWAYQWLHSLEEQTRLDGEAGHRTTPVAIATADLSWGTVLTDEMTRIVAVPADAPPKGHFPSTDGLKGRVLIADIKQHEPILESKLAPTSVTVGGISAITHSDKRAVAVRVDDVVAVGGFIKPGDRVDVLATLRRPGETDAPVTKVVLENIRVLAIGQDVERTAQHDEAAKDRESTTVTPSVMTLEVTPAEAEQLALASTEGKVQLALRNPQSATTVYTAGATIPSLLDSYGGQGEPRSDRRSGSLSRSRQLNAALSAKHAPSAAPFPAPGALVRDAPANEPTPPAPIPEKPAPISASPEVAVVASAPLQAGTPSSTSSSASKGPASISVELIRGMTRSSLTFEPARSDASVSKGAPE
jgi:pilus assembly protein CpaB